MLSLIGFITILAILLLLLSGRVSPIIPLVLVPIAGALVAGYGFVQISGFFGEGIHMVLGVVVMFVFAILYFCVMKDTGLFDPLIEKMLSLTRGSVVSVCVGTVIIGAVAHLDGSGATTFLIAIPPLLPLYKRLRMDPYLLMLLVSTSAAIMNMVPWGGPLGRSAVVLKADPAALWRPLIGLQVVGMVLLIGMAVILGLREMRRIARADSTDRDPDDDPAAEAADVHMDPRSTVHVGSANLARPRLLWLNSLLTIAVIGTLVWGVVPPEFVFVVAFSIALPINYPTAAEQMNRIRAYAPGALLMAAIILAAGSFLGIMSGTGMLTSIATDTVALLPAAVSKYLHVIVGVLGIPLELVLNTDAFFFALMPVVIQMVSRLGVNPISAAYPMIIGKVTGTFVCPLAPALWLGLGVANLEMGKYLRYSFFWVWGFSLVLLLVAWSAGLFAM